jgi:hypothetical protein
MCTPWLYGEDSRSAHATNDSRIGATAEGRLIFVLVALARHCLPSSGPQCQWWEEAYDF